MARTVYINLPVADVARATTFYQAVGFTLNPAFSNEKASAMFWSDAVSFMLLRRDTFAQFAPGPVAEPREATAALFCLSQDSRAAVDALVQAAADAGGEIDLRPAQDHGFMYGRTFADPDGHVFEVAWMDAAGVEAMVADASEAA